MPSSRSKSSAKSSSRRPAPKSTEQDTYDSGYDSAGDSDFSKYAGRIELYSNGRTVTSYDWEPTNDTDYELLSELYTTKLGNKLMDNLGTKGEERRDQFDRVTFTPSFDKSRKAVFSFDATSDQWSSMVTNKQELDRKVRKAKKKKAKAATKAAALRHRATLPLCTTIPDTAKTEKGKNAGVTFTWTNPNTGTCQKTTVRVAPTDKQRKELLSSRKQPPVWLIPSDETNLDLIRYIGRDLAGDRTMYTWERALNPVSRWRRTDASTADVMERKKNREKGGKSTSKGKSTGKSSGNSSGRSSTSERSRSGQWSELTSASPASSKPKSKSKSLPSSASSSRSSSSSRGSSSSRSSATASSKPESKTRSRSERTSRSDPSETRSSSSRDSSSRSKPKSGSSWRSTY